MGINGEILLVFFDENIDLFSLSNIFREYKVRKKDEIIGENRIVPNSFFAYKKEFEGNEDFGVKMIEVTKILEKNYGLMNKFIDICDKVEFNVYVRSNQGQFGLNIPTQCMTILGKLNLDIDINLLSYGEV